MLAGYAFFGKGFASLGIAPLFLGEALLAAGLLVVARSWNGMALFATWAGVLLLALLAWVGVLLVPSMERYGITALRDAVIVGYGLFTMVVISLVVERPERLNLILQFYGRFASVYGLVAAPLFFLAGSFGAYLPLWPVSRVPLVFVRPGEIAVHLVGVVVFALVGFRRVGAVWITSVILAACVISPSRGATLAFLLPVSVALTIRGHLARMAPLLLAAGLAFGLAYAGDLDVRLPGGRSMGPHQIVANLESLLGHSSESNLDNTKTWRLAWWQAIRNYTLHGDYFWVGKGFGQSLAEVDGFVVGEESGGPPLRSPHNAHLTMLARTGVPGLALWGVTLAAWFTMLGRGMALARRSRQPAWQGLFLWIGCYVAAILVDASFDVALEGPMLGIWFWSLFGLGIGGAMVQGAAFGGRAEPRDDAPWQVGRSAPHAAGASS